MEYNCIDGFRHRINMGSHHGPLLKGVSEGDKYTPPELLEGKRVKVYRNIGNNTDRKWSILDPKTGLVIGHADHVHLTDVELIVDQSGFERVSEEGRRNVHAYAVGNLQVERMQLEANDAWDREATGLRLGDCVRYNPHLVNFFYTGLLKYENHFPINTPLESTPRLALCDSGDAFLAEIEDTVNT
jgi:hypothetical protein